jgi:hypothetical protein
MTLSDLLMHLEWLFGGVAGTAVLGFGALYWVWSYSCQSIDRASLRIETAYQKADNDIRQDVSGVRAQVSAFQTDMYTKEMGGALESRIVTRIDRVEDKIDERMDRLGDKFDEFMRVYK